MDPMAALEGLLPGLGARREREVDRRREREVGGRREREVGERREREVGGRREREVGGRIECQGGWVCVRERRCTRAILHGSEGKVFWSTSRSRSMAACP